MKYPLYVKGIAWDDYNWYRDEAGAWECAAQRWSLSAGYDFGSGYKITAVDLTGVNEIIVMEYKCLVPLTLKRSATEPSVWHRGKCLASLYEHEIIAKFLAGTFVPCTTAKPVVIHMDVSVKEADVTVRYHYGHKDGKITMLSIESVKAIPVVTQNVQWFAKGSVAACAEKLKVAVERGNKIAFGYAFGDENGPWTPAEIKRGQRIYDLWDVKRVGLFSRAGDNKWQHDRFEVAPIDNITALGYARTTGVVFYDKEELMDIAARRVAFCSERQKLLDDRYHETKKKFDQLNNELADAIAELAQARQRLMSAAKL